MRAKLYTKTIGKGKNLVLLHGWGFHSEVFHPLIQELLTLSCFCITVIDLPGFGRSPALKEFKKESLCQDNLLVLISQLIFEQAPKNAVWLGWSLGGLVAMKIATLYSDHIAGLITLASTPKFINDIHWSGVTLGFFARFAKKNEQDLTLSLKEFLQWQGIANQNSIAMKLLQECVFFQCLSFRSSNKLKSSYGLGLKIGLQILKDTDLRSDLMNIRCPVLCLFGEKDQLVPSTIIPLLNQISPNIKTRIIYNGGHAFFLTEQVSVVEEITQFLLDNNFLTGNP